MRIICALACMLVASDCYQKASGPVALFSSDAMWLWYLVAAAWVFNGLSVFFNGAD
jgi:hypothetical protein